MITRVRIEAQGASAAEVEATMVAAANVFDEGMRLQAIRGEQVIQREFSEPCGSPTAFSGRLVIHPNVASDGSQVERLAQLGVTVTPHAWTTADAYSVGGVPTV